MKDFRKLNVWEKSHYLTISVYKYTKTFPKDELYGLTNQIRRASVSIPANIGEGCGRDSDAELARFCHIAMGSASKLEYHFLLTHDLKYLESSKFNQLTQAITEVKRMLTSFIQKLKAES